MKKVIKHPKKMKNAMYIVFGVFALALFVITRTGSSYATDGLMIDNALDSIVLYGEVEQLSEDEEVEEVQDEEAQEIEQNQEVEEEEDIVEPEETSDEEINEEEKTSEDLDETILERDSKEIDKSENKEEPQDKEENHGVSDENGDNEENKQEQKVEEEVVCKNKEGNVESSEEFGFKTPENKITEEIQLDIIKSEEIYGTGEYEGVKVEVYAQTGAFPLGTILSIVPITGDDEMSDIQDVLEEQKNVEKTEKLIAFDITFLDPETNEELQPLTGTVQVSFNYEENEELKAAEQDEEQEVKVYHLNDKDEEGEKVEEIKDVVVEEVVVNEEKSEEENVMVVEAENFSVYTIVVQVKEEQLISFQYGMISIANPSNPSQVITIMDRNLGATTNDITDKNSYGYHYQWGNNYGFDSSKDISEISSSNTQINVSSLTEYSGSTFILSSYSWMTTNKNLWGQGGQGPCPEGWHVPTTYERRNLKTYYNNTYSSGVNGFLNYFKLPYAGYRAGYNGAINYQGSRGEYWSSTQNGSNAYRLFITSSSISDDYYSSHAIGDSVRCFKNTPVDASNLHKITIDYRGGKGSVAFINVEHGSKAQVPSTPTRWNSSFLGWYLSGTTAEFNFNGTTITEDISIYAKWSCNDGYIENKKGDACVYVVPYNFDANGGFFFSGDEGNTVQVLQYFCDESECYTNDNLKNPQRISEDMSQQSGWMLEGWYMKSGENGDWGDEFNPKTATTTRVYAKWLPFNDISVKDGNQVGFTIMDRNLGAESTSYGSNLDGMGYYYQWGNNYGFSSNSGAIIKASSERVDVSGYGPDNYYSSNIFIKGNSSWDLSNNKNLWGGTGDSLKTRGEGTDEDRQGPCPVGYHIPSTLEWKYAYNVWNNSKEKSTDEDSDLKNFIKDFKLPFAGYRYYYNATVSYQGTDGYYLSSSPIPNSSDVYGLYLNNGGNLNTQYSVYPGNGYSVRCFKNLPKTKKIQYFTETGEKISEYLLNWYDAIPYINSHVERPGYEYLGWFESGSNEGFDFTEYIARSVSLYERWMNIEGITETDTAKLLNGKKFNAAIKTLATGSAVSYLESDNQIKGIERSEILPEGGVKKLISSDDSETPIFAWYDTETQKIKYYTKAKNVYMNEDSSYMYYYLKNLSSIDLSEFKTDYVRNMDWMFGYSFSSAEGLTLDFRDLDLRNVTSMANMFNNFFYQGSGATNVTINFSKMDLSNVKNVDKMFYYAFAYIENASGVMIDFSETNLSNVDNMNQMFYDFFYAYNAGFNINGVTVDFSKADLSGITDMNQMFAYSFYDVKNISGVTVDFSEADMKSVVNMNQMFYDFCYGSSYQESLTGAIIDFSKADLSNVENMNQMFEYSFAYAKDASGIKIDFSEVDLSRVKTMYQMFYYFCYGYVPNPEVGGSISGVTVDFSNANLSKVENLVQMFQYAFAYAEKVNGVTIDFSNTDLSNVKYMVQMFYGFCYGSNNGGIGAIIDGITVDFSKTNLRNVENMNQMFGNLFAYTKNVSGVKINFSDKDTSTLDPTGITVDFSKTNLSNVENMNQMFEYSFNQSKNISGLKIDFSELDLSRVTSMYNMFYDFCYGYNNEDGGNFTGITVDFSKTNLSNVENMNQMFQYAFSYGKSASGITINFSEADLSSVTNINNMFRTFLYGGGDYKFNITGVVIDFSKVDLRSLTGMNGMFDYDFAYAKTINGVNIDFSEANLSNVKTMNSMFSSFGYGSNRTEYLSGITIDFSKADLSSAEGVTSMFNIGFGYINSVKGLKIDFTETDFSSLKDMSNMFYNFCYGVKTINGMTIDFTKTDLSNVENMSYLFRNSMISSNGTEISDLSIEFDDAKITSALNNMSNMFASCGIEELDLSSFDTSNVTDMSNMFSSVYNLKTIYVGSRFRTSNVTSSSNMFSYAPKLVGGRGTKYSDSNPRDKTYARVDSLGAPGYFTKKGEETVATLLPGQQFNAKIKTIAKGSSAAYGDIDTYIKRIKAGTRDEMLMEYLERGTLEKVSTTDSEKPVYARYSDNDKTIYYYSEANIIDMNTESSKMFYNLTKLEEVELDGIETHGVKNMGSMFEGCSSLTGIDLSSLDTSSVTNTSIMFSGCDKLREVNMDGWDLTKVGTVSSYTSNNVTNYSYSENMGSMFNKCPSLEKISARNRKIPVGFTYLFGRTMSLSTETGQEIDVSGWNLSRTKSLQGLFADSKVRTIKGLETWNTSNIEDMNQMFYNCVNLIDFDISKFRTSKVTDMTNMFYNCQSITGLDLSHFDTKNVKSMNVMFNGCTGLETLNLDNWDLSNVYQNGSLRMGGMFYNLQSIKSVSMKNWKIPEIFTHVLGFRTTSFGSESIEELDVSGWDLSKTKNVQGLFADSNVKTIKGLETWDTSNIENMNSLFQNCKYLTSLDLSHFNTENVTDMSNMFQGDKLLKELNLLSFDTSNVTNMNSMFNMTDGSDQLKTIYVSENFTTENIENSENMFNNLLGIRGGNGTTYDENHIDKEYARVDKSGTPGYFTLGEFSIIYNLEGGDMEDMKTSYKLGESFEIGQPTKEENVFLGWTGSNGNIPELVVEIQQGTMGDLEFTANWKVNQYKIIFDTDGGNAINPVEIDYNSLLTGINLQTPTKECNEFSGWNIELPERMPAHDITLKAVWNYTCSKSSGGGGGGGGGSSTVKTKDDKDDHGVADEEKNINLEKEENKSIETQDNQVVENQINQEITQKVDDNSKKDVDTETVVDDTATSNNSSYTSEQKQSYEFAKSNGITTTSSIEQAKMNTSLTRIEMAKMLSYYAINVLGQEPDAEKGVVKFSDVTNKLDKEYDNGVTLAYQLGIMGQNMPNNKFRPNDEVTRAEFATALSRLLYNTDEGEYKGTRKYYEPHIAKLYNEGIINNTDSKMKEKRGYVMIMLMRTAK